LNKFLTYLSSFKNTTGMNSLKTQITIYQSTPYNIPDDLNLPVLNHSAYTGMSILKKLYKMQAYHSNSQFSHHNFEFLPSCIGRVLSTGYEGITFMNIFIQTT
jgi:hypothetical protein